MGTKNAFCGEGGRERWKGDEIFLAPRIIQLPSLTRPHFFNLRTRKHVYSSSPGFSRLPPFTLRSYPEILLFLFPKAFCRILLTVYYSLHFRNLYSAVSFPHLFPYPYPLRATSISSFFLRERKRNSSFANPPFPFPFPKTFVHLRKHVLLPAVGFLPPRLEREIEYMWLRERGKRGRKRNGRGREKRWTRCYTGVVSVCAFGRGEEERGKGEGNGKKKGGGGEGEGKGTD